MRRCTRCILPETFPGIQFDRDGVCQYCRRTPSPERRAAQRSRLHDRFAALVHEVRGQSGYHCLMSWSGGKDSTYTLWLLKEKYGLRILAFTFDNGFVSPGAFANMRTVAERLNVDHIIVKPDFDLLRQIFVASLQPGMYPPRALERASGVCNSCMGLAKGIALRIALEKEIPILAYGWSPGQIPLHSALFRANTRMLRAMLNSSIAPLKRAVGERIAPYFPDERLLERVAVTPYNISPLAFDEYDEQTAVEQISRLGWTRPQDTDPNSTNCLLNGFASLAHLKQLGYHPYVAELAGLVREGYTSRDDALRKLKTRAAPQVVEAVEKRLGVRLSE